MIFPQFNSGRKLPGLVSCIATEIFLLELTAVGLTPFEEYMDILESVLLNQVETLQPTRKPLESPAVSTTAGPLFVAKISTAFCLLGERPAGLAACVDSIIRSRRPSQGCLGLFCRLRAQTGRFMPLPVKVFDKPSGILHAAIAVKGTCSYDHEEAAPS